MVETVDSAVTTQNVVEAAIKAAIMRVSELKDALSPTLIDLISKDEWTLLDGANEHVSFASGELPDQLDADHETEQQAA